MSSGKLITGLAVATAGIFLFLSSCKHEIPIPINNGNNPPPPIVDTNGTVLRTCSPDSVYFANEIFPLITSTCAMSGCHDAVSHREGVNLTSYTRIVYYVKKGNAVNSSLFRIIASGEMPPSIPWTADQLSKLQKWINQGANNNICDMCDSANINYSTGIQPLIQNKCQGCHNPSSLGGGIDLSSYARVKASVISGKFYGSIMWSSGFSAMPKGGIKLSACEINQVKKWIDAGALNN